VKKKGNYRIPIGTPLRFVLETVGVEERRDGGSSSAAR
jgi:electron transport complex protein RnfC